MREFLNTPISELFKKESAMQTEAVVQDVPATQTQSSFLNRPISNLFKKNPFIESNEVEQKKSSSFLNRPISELFTRDEQQAVKSTKVVHQDLDQMLNTLDLQYEDLIEIYGRIQQFKLNTEIDEIVLLLESFREQFKQYLVLENGSLYQHLQKLQIPGEDQQRTMTNFRLEMHRLTNTILRFLRKWTEQREITKQNFVQFKQDYEATFYMLRARIERKNSILPILKSAR